MKGKLSATHTTLIPTAQQIYDFVRGDKRVTKVGAGVIRPGLPPAPIKVKLSDETGCVLLAIRSTNTYQELRVYSHDLQPIKLALARFVRDQD